MLVKTCTLCNKNFNVIKIEDFSKYFFRDKKGKYKHNARCKDCCRLEKQKLFKKYPEKMNPKWVSKAHNKFCIVCGSEFLAREDKQICCSDECRTIKNKVRRKMESHRYALNQKIKREKEIKEAKIRHKHYSDNEKIKIIEMLNKGYTYKHIAKKIGRTSIGVGKVGRNLKMKVII